MKKYENFSTYGWGGLWCRRICKFWGLEPLQKRGQGSREKRLDLWLKREEKKNIEIGFFVICEQ